MKKGCLSDLNLFNRLFKTFSYKRKLLYDLELQKKLDSLLMAIFRLILRDRFAVHLAETTGAERRGASVQVDNDSRSNERRWNDRETVDC